MKIWMISREYAGIAEAGGVKNVVCSLSEELSASGNSITLFIPEYGCTDFSRISCLDNFSEGPFKITVGDKTTDVSFAFGKCGDINVIFVKSEWYKEKNNVYTYCQKDLENNSLKNNPCAKIGNGYADAMYLDVLFQKAVCVFAKNIKSAPDVIHCHDACTALLPAFAKVLYPENFKQTKFVISIHNAGPAYHHEFENLEQARLFTELPIEVLKNGLNGKRVEPYVVSSDYAKLSTVSYDYADELLDPKNKNTDGLSKIFSSKNIPIDGITNGIDISRYSPEHKEISLLPFEFSPEKKQLEGKYLCRQYLISNYAKKSYNCISIGGEKIRKAGFLLPDEDGAVYISFHGRLVHQKGIPLIINLFDKIFSKFDNVRFIINGQGDPVLQEELFKKAEEYPGKILYLCGYEKSLARLCTAAGDFALFPSEFEPCGLEDFIAQIYGTIPVAHATGGLKKIINEKTGFTYSPNKVSAIFNILSKLIKNKIKDSHFYDELISYAACYVKNNYTWKIVANTKYVPLYES